MRIVHLVRNKEWGGGERYVADLCRASADNGDEVTVVTRGLPVVDVHFSSLSVDLRHLPLGGPLDLISPARLARWINEFPDDEVIIHVHNFKDAQIAASVKRKLRNKKRVAVVCTRHLVKRAGTSARWQRLFNDLDKIIFVSKIAQDVFLESDPKIPAKKITVIHNSIIPPEATKHYETRNETHLLFTGRITPEKGLDTLIEALSLLPDLPSTLSIAGHGEEKYIESLKKKAASLNIGDRIIWKGFVKDVYEEIGEADICIAPSVWREPFGLTIIEFMSQGKAVITSSNGAQTEIITDGVDGLLTAPGDSSQLADAIRKLVTSPDLRERIGKKAAETFSGRFSYPIFFSKIMNIYREALLNC